MAGHIAKRAEADRMAVAAAAGYAGSHLEAQGRGLRIGLEQYGFRAGSDAQIVALRFGNDRGAAKALRRADLECMTDAVYYEARGEGPRGQAAVAQVVMNRVSHPAAGLKGSYFALITLAFAEVFRIISNSVEITGGGLGMLIPMKQSMANFQFGDRRVFYFIILALTVVSILLALWLKASRFGARLAAIRENEDSARALGINIFVEKTKIMMISGAIAGVGGCFFAQYFLYIDPTIAFGVDKSVEMLLV
eukprot:gene28471-50330_t